MQKVMKKISYNFLHGIRQNYIRNFCVQIWITQISHYAMQILQNLKNIFSIIYFWYQAFDMKHTHLHRAIIKEIRNIFGFLVVPSKELIDSDYERMNTFQPTHSAMHNCLKSKKQITRENKKTCGSFSELTWQELPHTITLKQFEIMRCFDG